MLTFSPLQSSTYLERTQLKVDGNFSSANNDSWLYNLRKCENESRVNAEYLQGVMNMYIKWYGWNKKMTHKHTQGNGSAGDKESFKKLITHLDSSVGNHEHFLW